MACYNWAPDLCINQIVLNLWPPENAVVFDINNYNLHYNGKSCLAGYSLRTLSDVTYKLSVKLFIHLFIRKECAYYCTEPGFDKLYRHLVLELNPFLTLKVEKPVTLSIKIQNIQATFSLDEPKLKFIKNTRTVMKLIESCFTSSDRPILIEETEPDEIRIKWSLFFKKLGNLRFQRHKGSMVCTSAENFIKMRRLFVELIQFGNSAVGCDLSEIALTESV